MCQHLMKKVFQQMYHTAPEKASDALIADIQRRPFPMPPALRRVFTGQGMLQAKQVTQYFFLVLKKA